MQDCAFAINFVRGDIADVVYDRVGKARYQVKASVSEVAVDEQNAFSSFCDGHREIGAHRGFAYTALTGGEKNDLLRGGAGYVVVSVWIDIHYKGHPFTE
jgi:hypothetical protein